jgi:hypothetical protein
VILWEDEADVLRAVERDLSRQCVNCYKVIAAGSGISALEAAKQFELRNEPVALFLVDQRMPRMSGLEFPAKAIEFYPDAKRTLLTGQDFARGTLFTDSTYPDFSVWRSASGFRPVVRDEHRRDAELAEQFPQFAAQPQACRRVQRGERFGGAVWLPNGGWFPSQNDSFTNRAKTFVSGLFLFELPPARMFSYAGRMNVFVTGGAGYIGSVCTEELLNAGHQVTVYDNLTEGHRSAVDPRAKFIFAKPEEEGNILAAVKSVQPDAILHFAAFALVGESMTNPKKYFHNNLVNALNSPTPPWNAA